MNMKFVLAVDIFSLSAKCSGNVFGSMAGSSFVGAILRNRKI